MAEEIFRLFFRFSRVQPPPPGRPGGNKCMGEFPRKVHPGEGTGEGRKWGKIRKMVEVSPTREVPRRLNMATFSQFPAYF